MAHRRGSIENVCYEVSEKHLETNLHMICAGVSVSTTFMVPPHLGQSQDDPVIGISFAPVTVAHINAGRVDVVSTRSTGLDRTGAGSGVVSPLESGMIG